METRTFFSDETEYFRTPSEPDPYSSIHIRFRTGRYQAQKVFLCLENGPLRMQWEGERNDFDYYGADLSLEDQPVLYYFQADQKEGSIFYGKTGVSEDPASVIPFFVFPGFHTPQWSKGCLYYQIFPDRFCCGDPQNKIHDSQYIYGGRPVIHSDWGDPVSPFTFRQFYGGDLKGIIEKMPYLESLGVEALYLNPVFASPSSHKYDCCDYEHVDFGLGGSKDPDEADKMLAELISAAHSRGIKVILDGVFNHCSSYHRWFDKSRRFKAEGPDAGAYGNPDSRYHDRFVFYDDSCLKYESWWDVPTLPKLNYEGDPSLTDDIASIGRKWLLPPYNADGWRLDVAADLGHSKEFNMKFWQRFRSEIRSVNPDALIMAEHYEDPSPWLDGTKWDSIMNYRAFMDPVSYFFTGIEKHSDRYEEELKGNAEAFAETLTLQSALLPGNSLLSSLNQLDNHDHSRFLTRTGLLTGRVTDLGYESAEKNVNKAVLRQAAGFMYFWTGSPGLYYGDEAGLAGFTDPDNRRCYPWDDPDSDLLEFFGTLGALRKKYSFIKTASCRILYASEGVFSFARFTPDRALIITVSAADAAKKVRIPVWVAGVPGYSESYPIHGILYSGGFGWTDSKRIFLSRYGILETRIEPESLTVVSVSLT